MGTNSYGYIKLFEYVIEHNYTRAKIAKTIGVSRSTLTKYIKGEEIPTTTAIRKLCIDFNIPIKMILNYFYNKDISETEEFLINRINLIKQINVSTVLQKIKEEGYSYMEIGERIGVDGKTLSRYAGDESVATCELFKNICLEFHIQPQIKKYPYKFDIHSDNKQIFHNERSRLLSELQERYKYPDNYEAKGKEYKKIK